MYLNVFMTSRGMFPVSELQWAPTLGIHDPNPPINLIDGGVTTTATEAGTVTPSGALVTTVTEVLAGAITPTGAAIGQTVSFFEASTVAPEGNLLQVLTLVRSQVGSIEPTGELIGGTLRTGLHEGEIVPAGVQSGSQSVIKVGSIEPTGEIAVVSVSKFHTGTVAPSGTLGSGLSLTQVFTGTIGSSSSYTDLLNGEPTVPPVVRIGRTRLENVSPSGADSGRAGSSLVDVPFSGAVSGRGRTRLN